MKLIETVNDFIGLFIIAVIIVCVAMFIQNGYNNLTYITSKVDDRRYLVRNIKDKQAARRYACNNKPKIREIKGTFGKNILMMRVLSAYRPITSQIMCARVPHTIRIPLIVLIRVKRSYFVYDPKKMIS